MHPEHRSIGELAYHLWQARGCPQGSAERDWLDAERQLRSAQGANQSRAAESSSSDAVDRSLDAIDRALKETFPASDPPASQRADEPPANADAKWKAAASRKTPAVRSRRSKTAQGKPNAEPPS